MSDKAYRAGSVVLSAFTEGRYSFVYFHNNMERLHELYFGFNYASADEAERQMHSFLRWMNLDFKQDNDDDKVQSDSSDPIE